MTKKHFTNIARILAANPDATRDDIARALADYFEEENPRFNAWQFLTAAIN